MFIHSTDESTAGASAPALPAIVSVDEGVRQKEAIDGSQPA
jgi:hypothetical protein